MNKNYIIGGALIVGGGLYYAYTKGLLDKFIKPKETPKEESQSTIDNIKQEQKAVVKDNIKKVVINQIKKAATSITDKNSYAGKVSYIQSQLNVPVDGDAGAVTNKAFNAVYGLDKGEISKFNIDYYKKRVENKNTKIAIALMAKTNAAKVASAVNLSNDAKRFLELVNNGKYKATLKTDVKANAFVFDNLKKVFVDVNQPATFPKGLSFGKGEFSTQPRGIYVLKKGANNKYFAISINDFIVTI